MKLDPVARGFIAAGLGVVLLASCTRADIPFLHAAKAPRETPAASTPAPASAGAALPDFSVLVDRYGPAVVNIRVTETARAAALQAPNADDPIQQFFRHLIPVPHSLPMIGTGSGFIVSSDGVILTNAHVVDGASRVIVRLTNGREYKAHVVGADRRSDVAVLKIDARNLPAVRLGDSSEVKVGQWVVAIGSPYGFDNTVTSGILSAKARSLGGDTYVPFLQTDAPVNPGSSGGPLFDLRGDVVGINSQIYSRSGGYQGLSFAIPIEVAVKVKDALLAHGHVDHGRLGITVQRIDQGLADSFGLEAPGGVLVSAVDPNGPGAKAGLKQGDIIQKVNGHDVGASHPLPDVIAELTPGTRVALHVWRNDAPLDINATLGRSQDESMVETAAVARHHDRLGVVARPLTADEQSEVGVRGGLVVTEAGGPAAAAGIGPGDVILGVNGIPVSSVRQLHDRIAGAGKHVALLIRHEDATMYVPIDLG